MLSGCRQNYDNKILYPVQECTRTRQPTHRLHSELRRIGCGEMVQRTKRVSVGGERKWQGKRALKEMADRVTAIIRFMKYLIFTIRL